jgi:hypothetical protein
MSSNWRDRVSDEIKAQVARRVKEMAEEEDVNVVSLPLGPSDGLPMPWWRVGRHLGRTLYLQDGPVPSDSDQVIGFMDTPELGRQVCDAVNAQRTSLKHTGGNAEDCPICQWDRELFPWICKGDPSGD